MATVGVNLCPCAIHGLAEGAFGVHNVNEFIALLNRILKHGRGAISHRQVDKRGGDICVCGHVRGALVCTRPLPSYERTNGPKRFIRRRALNGVAQADGKVHAQARGRLVHGLREVGEVPCGVGKGPKSVCAQCLKEDALLVAVLLLIIIRLALHVLGLCGASAN